MKFFTFYKQIDDGDTEYYFIINRVDNEKGRAFFWSDEFTSRNKGWRYMGVNLQDEYWPDKDIVDSSEIPDKHQLIQFNFEGYTF